jgi:GT2 family glycosyltransferase
MSAGARVRANDWGSVTAPRVEELAADRSVTVVIPAFRSSGTLAYTLAALAVQSYPSDLLEVVVVDDGENELERLPEDRPERVRVVRAEGSWGRANACRAGALVADGEVIHWLDADMVPERDEVAQQMRWHHAADSAVVLGHKLFVDSVDLPEVAEVRAAAAEGRLEQLFADRWQGEHDWVEKIWRRTGDLRHAGFRAFHVHVGSTASVRRDLYLESGGMDPDLKLGEDIELGYRLAAKGAFFVGERAATSWHLGRTHLMRHQEAVQRYNAPHIAQRVPDFRKFRQLTGRSYAVPYVEVAIDVAGRSFEEVKFSVDGVLRARPGDVRCVLVGAWDHLHDGRRDVLADDHLDARLLREEYAADARVVLVEKLEDSAFPAQFRLHLPVGWRPATEALERVCREMQQRSQGLRSVLLSDGRTARFERTAAFERAARLRRPEESLDEVVDEISETWWSDGEHEGFESAHAPAVAEVEAELTEPAARRRSWRR